MPDVVGKLLAFVLPLGLDSFAVAAAVRAAQVTTVMAIGAWMLLQATRATTRKPPASLAAAG